MHCWVLVTHGRGKCMYIVDTWFFKKFQLLLRLVCAPKYLISWKAICCFRSYGFLRVILHLPPTPPPKKKRKKGSFAMTMQAALQRCKGKVSHIATQWFCGDLLLQNHCWFELAWISVHQQSPETYIRCTLQYWLQKDGICNKISITSTQSVIRNRSKKKHHKCHV